MHSDLKICFQDKTFLWKNACGQMENKTFLFTVYS